MTGIKWKDIDEPLFARIVDAILDRIHGDNGHAPEGRGGDGGIDYTANDNDIIYQYKFYADGNNTSSRRRKLKRDCLKAVEHGAKEWVVVIPAKILEAMRTHILGLSSEIKITIRDQAWLDNRLAEFGDLGEYFKYRTEFEYLHAKGEELKINPVFRNSAEVADKAMNLQRAVDASDPDWTFDISTLGDTVVQKLRAKHANSATRSPINISYTAVVALDGPEREQLDLSWDWGVIEPINLDESMVRDFKITGPELVAYEGPVGGLRMMPDPDLASPWEHTDLVIYDSESNPTGTHFARSRFLARGNRGVTIEAEVGRDLLRILFRTPDQDGSKGQINFTSQPFAGRSTTEILEITELLLGLKRGARLEVKVAGSRLMGIELGGGAASDWPDYYHEIWAVADDLAVIERQAHLRFRFPGALTQAERIDIRTVRLMLEGHVVAHPTYTQMNAQVAGDFDPTLNVLLNDEHGWMIWRSESSKLVVLDQRIDADELAVGGPVRLSDEDKAALRKARDEGTADGFPLHFRVEPDDRLRIWLPTRFKGDTLYITPWAIPGIQQPSGTMAAIGSAESLEGPRPPTD